MFELTYNVLRDLLPRSNLSTGKQVQYLLIIKIITYLRRHLFQLQILKDKKMFETVKLPHMFTKTLFVSNMLLNAL